MNKDTPSKMRYCFNCGAELDFMPSNSAYADRLDTCGSKECERAARDAAQQEREEAHEQLDRDLGW